MYHLDLIFDTDDEVPIFLRRCIDDPQIESGVHCCPSTIDPSGWCFTVATKEDADRLAAIAAEGDEDAAIELKETIYNG